MMNLQTERGASLVEYALVVALVAAIALGGLMALGGNTAGAYDEVAAGLGGEPGEPSDTTATTGTTAPASTTV